LADGHLIIVDAGSGIRLLGKQLLAESGLTEMCLLLTHSHWDHLLGFPFFVPAYLSRFRIHVRGGPLATSSLSKYLAHQMEPPYFPVEFNVLQAEFDFEADGPHPQCSGTTNITPIRLSHPDMAYGFRFAEGERAFVLLTDNEPGYAHPGALAWEDYVEFARGADVLFHDAQYTEEEYGRRTGWGHSTFSKATRLAREAGVRRLGFFHHDPDRSDDDLDARVEAAQAEAAAAGSDLECFACREGMEVCL